MGRYIPNLEILTFKCLYVCDNSINVPFYELPNLRNLVIHNLTSGPSWMPRLIDGEATTVFVDRLLKASPLLTKLSISRGIEIIALEGRGVSPLPILCKLNHNQKCPSLTCVKLEFMYLSKEFLNSLFKLGINLKEFVVINCDVEKSDYT
jgi:hypothetical protein